jgi:hypothetical protein
MSVSTASSMDRGPDEVFAAIGGVPQLVVGR